MSLSLSLSLFSFLVSALVQGFVLETLEEISVDDHPPSIVMYQCPDYLSLVIKHSVIFQIFG